MRLILRYACFALWLAGLITSVSADDVFVDVKRQPDNVYQFELSFLATAPVASVFDILTDFNHLHRLNPSIQSSRMLESDQPGVKRVEVISRNCLLLFCKTLTRVEDVRMIDKQTIEATLIPAMSNFKRGSTLWTFVQENGHTRVTMQGLIVPDFWVPPLIGPHTIKKRLRSQLHDAAGKINELANTSSDD